MSIELTVPSMGESITEVEIGTWLKGQGEQVSVDDPIVVLESDKASLELPAPSGGYVARILKKEGETAEVGEVIGYLEAGEGGGAAPAAADKPAEKPAAAAPKAAAPSAPSAPSPAKNGDLVVMPAAQRLLDENGLKADQVPATGPGGRLLKEDVQNHLKNQSSSGGNAAAAPATEGGSREEELVRMTPIRRRIAERLVEAQQTAALLTTFNEVDMSSAMALRKEHQDAFVERHGIKLGFMSFFVKAAIEALKEMPAINAEIRGTDVAYRNYYDIGVAVGGPRGLVVPVIRNAERLSFAGVEKTIADFGKRARENTIKLEELSGGTFTISNGGVYGSLMSTPIVNPPQSGILGMHSIQKRPVVVNDEIVIRPMMYIALTYDHRIVDGKEAVTFLKRIKELIEAPARLLLEV